MLAKVTLASLLGAAEALLSAPCYGYGDILGSPSTYLSDDMDNVRAFEVGKGNVYVANLNYLFEGKNFLKIGY